MLKLQEEQRKLNNLRQELDTRTDAVLQLSAGEKKSFFEEELPRRENEIKSLHELIQTDSDLVALRERNQLEMKASMATDRMGLFGGGGQAAVDGRSLGERFTQSEAYLNRSENLKMMPIEAKLDNVNTQNWQMQGATNDPSNMKATFTGANGFAPFIPRSNLIVPLGQIKPVIADLIPQENTDVAGGKYMEEYIYQNNAAVTPEGTVKPEAALGFREVLFGMAKIAVTLPVTDEQLQDVPQVRALLDNRLGLMVRQQEDAALLNNIASNGFDGFLVKAGVQTRALGADEPIATGVLALITSIEFDPGFASVSALVMNPQDWFKYVTYQTTTGAYVAGNPATESAITSMWGMPIIRTNRMPMGTALMGDFATYAAIFRRMELAITVGWINDDFIRNIQRIIAEERATLQILRASAFGKLTGI